MSEVLGGGTASIGVSATSDMETKMNTYVGCIYLSDKILSTPPSQLNKYNVEVKKICKAMGGEKYADVSFWSEHYAEREEWERANNKLNDLNLMAERLDVKTRKAYEEC